MVSRKRNKEDTRARVAAAARALFAEHGFDGTTIRAIAARAEVATGTVLLYGPSKTELLLHLFVDELEEVVERSLATLDPAAPLVDQLVHLFEGFVVNYARQPALARVYVKETLFAGATPQAERYATLTGRFVWTLAERIAVARPSAPAPQLAVAAFGVYLVHVGEMLRHDPLPPLDVTLASLRGTLVALFPVSAGDQDLAAPQEDP